MGNKQNKAKERARGIGTCFFCKREVRKEDCQKKSDGSLPDVVAMVHPGKPVRVFACADHPGVAGECTELVDLDALLEPNGRPEWLCGYIEDPRYGKKDGGRKRTQEASEDV